MREWYRCPSPGFVHNDQLKANFGFICTFPPTPIYYLIILESILDIMHQRVR